jgi:DNA-binding CsgD family transcriptional regulator
MVMRGSFEEAKRQAILIQERASKLDQDYASGLFGMQMFVIERAQGGISRLPLELVRAAANEGGWKPGAIAMYTEFGLAREVALLLPDVISFCEETTVLSGQWSAVAVFAAEAAAFLRDRGAAHRLKTLLAPFVGTNMMMGHLMLPFGSADRCLALLDHVLGLPTATELFERGLDLDRRVGSVTHEAETLLSFAAHLDAIGEPSRADEIRRQGHAIADRIGFRRRIPLVDAPPRSSAPAPSPSHAGLTPREIEVLRLLATGASNREIGEALFISTNTAANHVRSILMKTGNMNRTQAAIYAAEHGLLDVPI